MTTRVGLTGSIATGKSTVAAMLADLGAVVIDADALAREVVAKDTAGLRAVVEEFGEEGLGDLRGMKELFGETLKRRTYTGAIVLRQTASVAFSARASTTSSCVQPRPMESAAARESRA